MGQLLALIDIYSCVTCVRHSVMLLNVYPFLCAYHYLFELALHIHGQLFFRVVRGFDYSSVEYLCRISL